MPSFNDRIRQVLLLGLLILLLILAIFVFEFMVIDLEMLDNR